MPALPKPDGRDTARVRGANGTQGGDEQVLAPFASPFSELGQPEQRAELDGILGRADQAESELTGKLYDALIDQVFPIAGTADELGGKLLGALGVQVDQCEKACQKLIKKLYGRLGSQLESAYAYGSQIIPGYPTREQVSYGLTTGDYLGSMGVLPDRANPDYGAIGLNGGASLVDGRLKTLDTSFPPVTIPGDEPPPPAPGTGNGGGTLKPTFPPSSPPPNGPPSSPPPSSPPTSPSSSGGCGVGISNVQVIDLPGNNGNAYLFSTTGITIPAVSGNTDPCLWGALGMTYEKWCFPADVPLPAGAPRCAWFPSGSTPYVDSHGNVGAVWTGTATTDLVRCMDPTGEMQQQGCPVQPIPTGGGQCCPPPKVSDQCTTVTIDWCDPPGELPDPKPSPKEDDLCKLLDSVLEQAGDLFPELWPGLKIPSKMLPFADPGGNLIEQWMRAFTGQTGAPFPTLVNGLVKWLKKFVEKATKGLDCDREKALPFISYGAVLGFVQQWFGVVPRQLTTEVNQFVNYACQTQIPTGDEADAAYLADKINRETWECWRKANGDRIPQFEKVMEAKRVRPDALQLARLFRRKKIDFGQYTDRIRAAGTLELEDRQAILDLTEAWPGLEDVIRFMVRDVADPAAIDRGQLDTDFEQKWQGKLKDFADGAGVSDDLARLYWRAHWKLPSPTQLFEMLHRLRPGAVSEDLAVTPQLVEDTLKQDDLAPAFVKRLMAVSYNPITRTDAARMYQLRTIGNDELTGYFQDEGLAEQDAQRMTQWAEKNRNVQEVRRSGLPTPRAIVTRYGKGLLSRSEFERLAGLVTYSDEQAEMMKAAGELEKQVLHRTRVLSATKKGYLRGMLDDGDAIAQLVDGGVQAEEANELVADWSEERDAAGKVVSAEKLCKWRTMGIITPSEHAKALERLNWSPFQAERIMLECELKEYERQLKLAEKKAKEAQAKADQADKARQACLPKKKRCAEKGYPTE